MQEGDSSKGFLGHSDYYIKSKNKFLIFVLVNKMIILALFLIRLFTISHKQKHNYQLVQLQPFFIMQFIITQKRLMKVLRIWCLNLDMAFLK